MEDYFVYKNWGVAGLLTRTQNVARRFACLHQPAGSRQRRFTSRPDASSTDGLLDTPHIYHSADFCDRDDALYCVRARSDHENMRRIKWDRLDGFRTCDWSKSKQFIDSINYLLMDSAIPHHLQNHLKNLHLLNHLIYCPAANSLSSLF